MDTHDGVPAHTQRERREGVRHDCQSALLMDLGDSGFEALAALQTGLQEDSKQMAAAGGDFFGDDHIHPAAALAGQALALDRGLDTFVIGDGEHVEVRVALNVVQDLGGAGRAIRRD